MKHLPLIALWLAASQAALWGLPALAGGPVGAQAAASLALAAVQALVTVGVGLVALRVARFPARTPSAEGGLALFIGAGIVSTAVLLLGLAGLCSVSALRLIFGVGLTVLTAPAVAAWLARLGRSLQFRPSDLFAYAILAALGLLLALHAAMPPLAYDVLEYHLAVPRVWLRAGEIAPVAGNFFSHQPFLGEMNFMVALALGADALPSVPKFLNLTALVAALALVMSLARKLRAGRLTRGAAAGLTLATPLVFKICTDALVDIWVVLGVLAALHAWHRWIATRHPGALLTAAVSLGILATVKQTALAIWVVPMAVVMVGTLIAHRAAPAEWMMSLPAIAIWPVLALLPWWIKELVWTGNPFFPLAHGLFGGEGWSEAQAHLLVAGHGLRSPISGEYWADVWRRLNQLGPCPLSLLLGGALMAWRRAQLGFARSTLALTVLAYLLWNLLAGSADRFAAPAAALVAAMGAAALHTTVAWCRWRWGRRHARWGALVAIVPLAEMAWRLGGVDAAGIVIAIAAGFVVALLLPLLAEHARPSVIAGWGVLVAAATLAALVITSELSGPDPARRRLRYLTGRMAYHHLVWGLPHLQAHRQLNAIIRPEGQVLLVYEARTFHLDAPAVYGTVFDGQPLRGFVRGAASLGEVFERLRTAGISHVLVNGLEADRLAHFYFRGQREAIWNFPTPLSSQERALVDAVLSWAHASIVWGWRGEVAVAAVPQ